MTTTSKQEGYVSEIEIKVPCTNCGHARIDHVGFSGPCDFIKWVGGHPEYRCMCRKYVKKASDGQ